MTNPISESDTNLSLQIIEQTIEKLTALNTVDVRSNWRSFSGDMSVAEVFASDFSRWDSTQLNAKGHIAWEKGKKVQWLAQKLVIPKDLQGYSLEGFCLRLALVWWADSTQVYINGSLAAEGDLFDCSQRILLTNNVSSQEEFTVALRLVSPGHDDGALVSSSCVYEAVGNNNYPSFVASELAIALRYCQAFAPEKLDVLAEFVKEVALSEKKDKEIVDNLLAFLSNKLNQSKISLVGHAHLDMAWLWRVSETWEAAKNTFKSVLNLQADFPELIFCHSTPALYHWVEENCPDLFARIKQAVKNNLWEVVGAFWIEPELNLISGESIVRQLLYGQRYVKERFGKVSTVAWLPDSFGFCWTLPQFMISAGVEYFVTQKLIWNDTTSFPHGTFWWRSPDGSEIFSLMSAPIGEGINPVKMVEHSIAWEQQTGLQNYLWLPGVGDHGGGPTRDMLETARRWQDSPLCPDFEFTTVEKYLEEIKGQGDKETRGQGDKGTRRQGDKGTRGQGEELSPNDGSSYNGTPVATTERHFSQRGEPAHESGLGTSATQWLGNLRNGLPPQFPIWNDELYLEFHRGCYTTHGDQKLYNRRGENLLYEAELFAALASICCGVDYPQAEIEGAWKKLLFNQFHDILPGSSIKEVYDDALPQWQQMETSASEILKLSLETLATNIDLPPSPHPDSLPVVVFNSLNWQRCEVVSVCLPRQNPHQQWQVYDSSGNQVTSQIDADAKLLFLTNDIPAVGYRLFWLSPSQEETIALEFQNQKTSSQNPESIALQFFLENEFLRVVVDEQTGDLSSVFDKLNNREVLSASGNQLQAFTDKGQYWDAWNIDPNYAEYPLPALQLKSIEWLERGLLQNRLRVTRQLGESEFIQDYILQASSPILKIATKVNWLERHILVKAAFPLNLETDFATYEIACGVIQRTTKPQTAAEKAKWEVPALRWADLTQEGNYGVSLLNDCKYGYDATPNQLRLSLLRSPEWPNPEADKGFHEFSYGLYPHAGSWQKAQTVKRGYEFNQSLKVVLCQNQLNTQTATTSKIKEKASFIDISGQNLILMAFKQTEDNPQQWILRCYECHGETAEFKLNSDIGLNVNESVDLLESPLATSENSSESSTIAIAPWKIASFKIGNG